MKDDSKMNKRYRIKLDFVVVLQAGKLGRDPGDAAAAACRALGLKAGILEPGAKMSMTVLKEKKDA